MHFEEGTAEYDALVKHLASDEGLFSSALSSVLGSAYGFDLNKMRDIGRRIAENPDIYQEEFISEQTARYAKKRRDPLINSVFPMYEPFTKSGSEANRLAIDWVHRKDTKTGYQALISYHDRWYLIQKLDDSDLGYIILRRVLKAEYNDLSKEIKEYGKSEKIISVQGGFTLHDKRNKSSYSLKGRGPGVNSTGIEYRREDRQVVRMATSETDWGERDRRDRSGDSSSSGADRPRTDLGVSQEELAEYAEFMSEISAHMGELLLGTESFIDRVIRTDAPLAEKIIGKIVDLKEAFGRIGDPEAQAQHKRLAEAERLYLKAAEAAGYKYQGGKMVSMDEDEEKEKTVTSMNEENMQVSGGKYSYNSLIKKDDMVIETFDVASVEETSRYRDDTVAFGKEMRDIATKKNNSKNTAQSTYLYCGDLDSDVLISRNSFKHSGARLDKEYVTICQNIDRVLENAIVVNELNARDNATNGAYVLLCVVEIEQKHIIVRCVINKRTHHLEEFQQLDAIRKQAMKKGDVSLRLPDYLFSKVEKGSVTSPKISISNLIDFVKTQNLANEVFSKDVCQNLEIKKSSGSLSSNLRYSFKEDSDTTKEYKQYSQKEVKALVGDILSGDWDEDEAKYAKKRNSAYIDDNPDDLYTSTDDFIQRVPYGARSAFARALSMETRGLKDGENKTLHIYCDGGFYTFFATGYMKGEILDVENAKQVDLFRMQKRRFINGIDGFTEGFDTQVERDSIGGDKSRWNPYLFEKGKPTKRNAGVSLGESGSEQSADNGEIHKSYSPGEIQEIIEGVKKAWNITDADLEVARAKGAELGKRHSAALRFNDYIFNRRNKYETWSIILQLFEVSDCGAVRIS